MTTGPDLHLVDVFARERYAGNQLAVVENDGQVVSTGLPTIVCRSSTAGRFRPSTSTAAPTTT